jgi:hypothetical protein
VLESRREDHQAHPVPSARTPGDGDRAAPRSEPADSRA